MEDLMKRSPSIKLYLRDDVYLHYWYGYEEDDHTWRLVQVNAWTQDSFMLFDSFEEAVIFIKEKELWQK